MTMIPTPTTMTRIVTLPRLRCPPPPPPLLFPPLLPRYHHPIRGIRTKMMMMMLLLLHGVRICPSVPSQRLLVVWRKRRKARQTMIQRRQAQGAVVRVVMDLKPRSSFPSPEMMDQLPSRKQAEEEGEEEEEKPVLANSPKGRKGICHSREFILCFPFFLFFDLSCTPTPSCTTSLIPSYYFFSPIPCQCCLPSNFPLA